MNKKLLFTAMSLAALTACNSDDFESQQIAEQAVSPIKFEVLNNSDALTRASMGGTSGNKVVWNANDGDLFTLYHGAAADAVKGFENATYTAQEAKDGETKASLTTPSMIKEGRAIMVWPVDTTFRITPAKNLTLKIDAVLEAKDEETGKGGVENAVPYVSDLVNIAAYDEDAPYNTAGYQRTYPIYMRPMGSILNLKAEWAGKKDIDDLTKLAVDPIAPITLTSVKLMTENNDTKTMFTTVLPIKFTLPGDMVPAIPVAQWALAANHRAWEKVTDIDLTSGDLVKGHELTTKCIDGTELARFVILPQANIDPAAGGVSQAAVEVNTYYGKVLIAKAGEYPASKYTDDEYNAAWYRIVSSAQAANDYENASTPVTIDGVAKHKVVAKTTALGMAQTINFFSTYKAKDGVVKDEPTGTAVSRYVKVDLQKLDMSDLHIKTDKQLYDVVRVWNKLGIGAGEATTVILDGDATNGEFEISQRTIKAINKFNAEATAGTSFAVKPCKGVAGEVCNKIVITGSSQEQKIQDLTFIKKNGAYDAATVVLAGEGTAKPWIWDGTVKVGATDVAGIINMGVMESAETKTLKTAEADGTQNNVQLVNQGTWNITAGTINVQFTVWNTGNVNIAKGAQYREDGNTHIFYNYATDKPTRFGGDDTKIGTVINEGVFATVADGQIWNVGLIEHADVDAKTYITRNSYGNNYGAIAPDNVPQFAKAFEFNEDENNANMFGRINLPFSNKEEDNVSVSAALSEGFVSVTVNGEVSGALDASVVGPRVNYVIVNRGITSISAMSDKVKYLEIAMLKDNVDEIDMNKEIAWNVTGTPTTYEGLMILSPVNIKLNTTINVTKATYLGADMYVGGTFTPGAGGFVDASWNGYYGNTAGNYATKYITY